LLRLRKLLAHTHRITVAESAVFTKTTGHFSYSNAALGDHGNLQGQFPLKRPAPSKTLSPCHLGENGLQDLAF